MYVCVCARVRALYLRVYGHCVQMSMLMNSEAEVFLNHSPHFQAGLLTVPRADQFYQSSWPAGSGDSVLSNSRVLGLQVGGRVGQHLGGSRASVSGPRAFVSKHFVTEMSPQLLLSCF